MKLPRGGVWAAGKREYIIPCPRCTKKFSWSLTKTAGQCFSCKFVINGIAEFYKYFPVDEGGVEFQAPAPQTRYPDDNEFLPAFERNEAATYLMGRGVSKEVAEHVGILATSSRIYVPCYSPFGGKQPMMMSRSILPGQKGWMAPTGVDKSKYWFWQGIRHRCLILVEGIFDVLTPGLNGFAVALLGSKLGADLEVNISRIPLNKVLLWLDPDEPGVLASKRILGQLRAYGLQAERVGSYMPVVTHAGKLEMVFIPAPEPGSCTPEKAREILRGHSCYV